MEEMNSKWESLMFLVGKIDDQATRLSEWDKLRDLSLEVLDYVEECKNNEQVLLEPYQYLYRLYLRVSHYKEQCEFDQVREQTGYEKKNVPYNFFTIHNYSFKTFLWARKNGLADEMTNGDLNIPVSKLDNKTALHFHNKAINPISNFLEQ